jgi:hypothetical protein
MYIPNSRVAQFYPRTLGSLSVNDKVNGIGKLNRKTISQMLELSIADGD